MRLTVKQPFPFWAGLVAVPFSGEQVAGSTATLTEGSNFITRITDAVLAESYVIEWSVLHPDDSDTYTAAFVSSDTGVATVSEDGEMTVISNGETDVEVTVTREVDGLSMVNTVPVSVSISPSGSIDHIENAAGSAGKAFDDGLDALIAGLLPETDTRRFSSRDLNTKTFTRNGDFFCIGLDGLSAISPNNSREQNRRAGTAVTKRHIICAAHYRLSVGDTVDFVADVAGEKIAVTRTVIQAKDHPLYRGASGGYRYDIQICLLDSDLPAEIDFMEVIPSNTGDFMSEYTFMGGTCLLFNQEQRATTTVLSKPESNGTGVGFPLDVFTHMTPDTMHVGANFVPSISGFSSPSDNVTGKPRPKTDQINIFSKRMIVGDSGSPCCFVLGAKLILIGLNTTVAQGSYMPNLISSANQLILDVDALAGISTGYTVTEADLSSYPTY